MPTPRIVVITMASLLALVPVSAKAVTGVGMLRPPATFSSVAVGQLAPVAGLEILGKSAQGAFGVYSATTGALLASMQAPFDALTEYVLQDFDGDGYEEVLCVSHDFNATGIGVEKYVGGTMTLLFPAVTLLQGAQFVGTMRLNAANPTAMVFVSGGELYIVRQNGVIRYDSTTDPAWPGDANHTASVQIGDFLGNGFDQLEVTLPPLGVNGTTYDALVGDPTPTLAVATEPITAQSRLLASRPNPANGPVRIGFELAGSATVQLLVYDAQGRLVNRLADGRLEAGRHERLWDGRDITGSRAQPGAYFYELVVDGARETRKLIQLH